MIARLLVIPLSLLVGLTLTILPLPEWARIYRPDWVALVLLYWSMALPKRVGLWWAFGCGVFVDVASGALLGQHSLGLVMITFINLNLHQRIRVMSFSHQSVYVLILLLINQTIIMLVEGMLQRNTSLLGYFGPALIGMALWPWVFIVLRDLRRKVGLRE